MVLVYKNCYTYFQQLSHFCVAFCYEIPGKFISDQGLIWPKGSWHSRIGPAISGHVATLRRGPAVSGHQRYSLLSMGTKDGSCREGHNSGAPQNWAPEMGPAEAVGPPTWGPFMQWVPRMGPAEWVTAVEYSSTGPQGWRPAASEYQGWSGSWRWLE